MILGILGALVWHFRLLGSTRGMLIIVAGCAGLSWMACELWDRRPANAPKRALRLARSSDPGERGQGVHELRMLSGNGSFRPEHIEVAVSALVIAMRDRDSQVREDAAAMLLQIISPLSISPLSRSSTPAPRLKAIATGVLEGVRDSRPFVRQLSTVILSNIYILSPSRGGSEPPLPDDTPRFVAMLGEALEDPNPIVRQSAFRVLEATASRVKSPPPGQLLAALHSTDAETRQEAIRTVVEFTPAVDQVVPPLLKILEQDEDPEVRVTCYWALVGARPSRVTLPALLEALRSPERRVRFSAANLISRIGPQASEAVPALLPLLRERFEPKTDDQRKQPTQYDPAVAATWAMGSIAPGTTMADMAADALRTVLRTPDCPWRHAEVAYALKRWTDNP